MEKHPDKESATYFHPVSVGCYVFLSSPVGSSSNLFSFVHRNSKKGELNSVGRCRVAPGEVLFKIIRLIQWDLPQDINTLLNMVDL